MAVGIDLIKVGDVRDSVGEFGERYLRRLFTNRELIDCRSSADPIPRLAARFAAKEATIKALKVDGSQPAWTSMEVGRDPSGWCDEMRLSGAAARLAVERGVDRLHVSLSHEDDAAIAVVLATRAQSSALITTQPHSYGPRTRGRADVIAGTVTRLDRIGIEHRRERTGADSEGPRRPIRIGFVNNMPDAAFEDTFRQFAALIGSGMSRLLADIGCYYIPAVPRSASVLETASVPYEDVERLYDSPPDALVVTGTEPRCAELSDEPYWDALAALLRWAESVVPSVLLSCLASHAAVLALDGIRTVTSTIQAKRDIRPRGRPSSIRSRRVWDPKWRFPIPGSTRFPSRPCEHTTTGWLSHQSAPVGP